MPFVPIVDRETANSRMSICRGCPHFNNRGIRPTCGTPIIGEKVKYDGESFHTCGCFLDLKVKFTAAACPLGKWGKRSDEDALMAEARLLLAEVQGNRITVAQVKRLNEIYPALVARRTNVTACPACLRAAIKELAEYMEQRPELKTKTKEDGKKQKEPGADTSKRKPSGKSTRRPPRKPKGES